MKLICDGLDLSEAVLKVVKAVSGKTTNPVLEGIKITAKQNSLTLLATDTEISIEKTIKADVLIEGETLIPGKYFSEFVKKLDKQHIELSLFNEQLKIKYADSDSIMQVLNVEEFPIIDKNINEMSFTMKQKEFKDMVSKTAFCCCPDESRPILKGCLLEVEEGLITCVGLDGFRLAVVKKNIISMNGNVKVICPQRALTEICRILEKDDEEITVVIQKNLLKVEIDNTCITTRLLEGEFIGYKNIIPQEFVSSIVANREMMAESVERASILAKQDRNNLIKFDIKEKYLNILSASSIGNVNENIPINLDGKDLIIALNSRYILESLRAINDEFIRINFNSAVAPCIICPLSGEEYLYLILPVRTNG
jgi:DNA polymerase-3 subunit beta